LTFLSEPNGFKPVLLGAHDSPFRMSFPLFVLVFPSIFVGYASRDLFIGLGTSFWNSALFIFPSNLNIIDSEFAPQFFKLLPVLFSITGAFCAFFFFTFSFKKLYLLKTSSIGKKIYNFLNKKWFFDKFYNEFINQALLNFGYHVSYKMIDRGIIEMVGPFGLSKAVYKNTSILARQHNGDVFMSIFWIFLGFSVFLILLHYSSSIVFLVGQSLIFLWVVTIAFI